MPIPESLWAAAGELAREHGINPTAKALHLEYGKLKQRAEAAGAGVKKARGEGPVREPAPCTAHRTADVYGADGAAAGSVPRAVVELEGPRGRMKIEFKGVATAELVALSRALVGWRGMIQITPQMRILVAVEPVDGRKGIDSLAQLCQERLQTDPFSGCLFVFRSRRGTAIRILVYDGQGFWLAQKRLSKGRFRWWPEGRNAREVARSLAAHQLQVLLAAGDPTATQAAPAWRPVSVVELRKNSAERLRSKFVSATLGGMEGEFRYRGRMITAAEVEFIRQLDRAASRGQPAATFAAAVRSVGMETGQRCAARHGLPRAAAGTRTGRASGVAIRDPCAPQPDRPARHERASRGAAPPGYDSSGGIPAGAAALGVSASAAHAGRAAL